MKAGDNDNGKGGSTDSRDYSLYYFTEDHKVWLPVPAGYEVDEGGKDVDDTDDTF
ncbi:hypothetical protein JVT61DRAFT_10977 [Boletus reticuloceps]|uniref:Uncharacterized protein n=1 Tax=Boletus reticuloceps TaxID=495285 RepID=A0A8I3A5S5_9AGAM|nr:hypothetical protein JVT61DRAFT_10977 [Boletus reticuloceps]